MHLPVEGRPIHFRHTQIAQNQIVDIGADAFERLSPVRCRMDLADSLAPHSIRNEFTKDRVIVHDEYTGAFKAPHVYVAVWASVARFLLSQRAAAKRARRAIVRWQGRRIVHSQAPFVFADLPVAPGTIR